MIAYLVQRLAWALVLLVVTTLAVFVVVHLSGDPTALYVGPEGTRADYEMVRAALGFDRPLPDQYGRFLARAVRADFGRSLRHQQPTLPLVLERFPATLKLALVAMALAVLLAVPLGILSALPRNSILDSCAVTFALSGQCMPTLGLELGNLLGGAVITEAVCAYPGIGRLAVEAVVNKDIPLLQAVVFTIATALILLNVAVDLLYMVLDPRVRLA